MAKQILDYEFCTFDFALAKFRNGISAAVLVCLGAILTTMATAETWEMATPYGAGNFHTQNITQFVADIEDATGGEIKINLHPGGSLVKHPEIKNAVRAGQIQLGEFAISLLANENAIYQVDALPFLVGNYEEAAVLWQASRPAIEALLDRQNIKVLYAVPWPPQGLYAKSEITDLEQMKGLKFRTYNSTTATIASLMGAVPAQIEAPDLAQAFATGRVEAMITSPTTGVNSKSWDYVSDFHHIQGWLPKNIVVINNDSFEGLSADNQAAVLAAADAAHERGWASSVRETNDALETLRANGMGVHDPSDKMIAQLRLIGDQITNDWKVRAGDTGADILGKLNP